MGALDVNRVVHRHQGWRLISCMWLHGGVFHVLANMLGILIIGIRLEQEFGFGMFDIFKFKTLSFLPLCTLLSSGFLEHKTCRTLR